MSGDDTTAPESANADTEPVDPAPVDPDRPAADDVPGSAQPPDGASTPPDGSGPDGSRSAGAGVAIPSWLAGALVVVLALVIGGAGFAIGRATAPDDDGFRPIVATDGGGRGEGSRTFPMPGGGRGGPDGLPGRHGPGGPQGRGGDDDQRRLPGFPDERPDGSDSGDSDTPAPPDLPGT